MVSDSFNAKDIEPLKEFEPIPSGAYNASIIESEIKNTKNSEGSNYWELVWEIRIGPYEGRKVWHRITRENPSEKAHNFGRRMMSAVCHAVGKLEFTETGELHDIPAKIRVKETEAQDGYPASNDVILVEKLEVGDPELADTLF